jgi:hypothetical protein
MRFLSVLTFSLFAILVSFAHARHYQRMGRREQMTLLSTDQPHLPVASTAVTEPKEHQHSKRDARNFKSPKLGSPHRTNKLGPSGTKSYVSVRLSL